MQARDFIGSLASETEMDQRSVNFGRALVATAVSLSSSSSPVILPHHGRTVDGLQSSRRA